MTDVYKDLATDTRERGVSANRKTAAVARSDPTVFHAIATILEGGGADADRIIDLCKAAAGRQLRLVDRALDEVDCV